MGIHRHGIGPFLLVGLYRGFAIWNNFHPFHRPGPLRRLQTHQSQISRRIGILLIVLFAFSFEIYGVIIWGYTVCCRNADALSISDSAAGRTRRRNGRWLFHNKSMARQQKKQERKKEGNNKRRFFSIIAVCCRCCASSLKNRGDGAILHYMRFYAPHIT